MTDRLRVGGDPVITEDDTTGDVTGDFDTINTERLSTTGYSGVDVGPASPTLQSQKTAFSWQNIPWEDKGEALIDGSSLNGSAGYSTYLNAEAILDNPIDTHYLYWSSHNDDVIMLSTASDIWGPWTSQGSVLSDPAGNHTASPEIIEDPANGHLKLYYHIGNNNQQYTKYATTSDLTGDGTSFTIQSVVLQGPHDGSWYDNEMTYLKIRRVGGAFVGVFQGRRPTNPAAIGTAWSYDGIEWVVEPTPAWDNAHWSSYDPQAFNGGAPVLARLGGELHILYHERSNEEVRAAPFQTRHIATGQEHETVYEAPSWISASANGITARDVIRDDEYVYLLYDQVENNNRKIGIARVPHGEIQ